MSPAGLLCLVLLATFGLITLTLSGLVGIAWRAGLEHKLAGADPLLALRLLPAAGGLLIAVTVVLPAFLSQERYQEREAAGPLLVTLATLALLALGHGCWRGWHAWRAARSLLRSWGPARRRLVASGQEVTVVDVPEPLVAVIGGWHPRIVAAECLIFECSREEFQAVIAHEAAHVSARDNLKLLLLIAAPDVVAWTRMGAALAQRWRAAAEFEADQRATANDPRRRVALAAALVKVARLLGAVQRGPRPALGMPVACDDVRGRVRRLLAPPSSVPRRPLSAKWVAMYTLALPVAALPFYPWVHRLIEALVRVGL